MRSFINGLRRALRSTTTQDTSRDRKRSKRTHIELLENRCLLASDVLASISGNVFDDRTDNGLTPDDTGIPAVVLDLYRDGGNGSFAGVVPGSDDTFVKSATTAAGGAYSLTGLTAGTYFVQQRPITGFVDPGAAGVQTVVVTQAQMAGVTRTPIDTFVTSQNVRATSTSPGARSDHSAATAPEAIGGERDLYVELTSNFGELQLSTNSFGAPTFQYDSSTSATGRRLVTWDGVDADGAALNKTGLGGLDLTENGAVEGVRFLSGSDHDGGSLTLRIYSDANNWSVATIAVPNTGSPGIVPFELRFADLTVGGGSGADLTKVGAVQMEIAGAVAVDGEITRIDTFGPVVLDADFLNVRPIDLVIEKTDDPDPVVAGTQLTYTLTVKNDSTITATGVTVTDELPDDVTYVSSSGNSSHASGVVTAVLGTMAPGATATVTIVVDVHADGPDTLHNTACVAGNEVEINLANNCTDEPTSVLREWDLQIVKSDNPDPVVAGEQLTYTLTVTNNSLLTATGVVVTDHLPADVRYVSSNRPANHSSGVVTANIGTMAPGATATISILVDVNSDAPPTILNTASVSGNETETTLANNTDDEPTEILREWDLQIVKSDNPDPVAAGGQLTYTLVVTNNGPSDATDVIVEDDLPPEVSFVSANLNPSQGTATHAAGKVTAELGDLAVGDTATITILTRVANTASGQINNTSVVQGNPSQPGVSVRETRLDNNRDDEPTIIVAPDSSIAGFVYVDADNDGVFDANERPLANVEVELSGFDYRGNAVTRRQFTASNGAYSFTNLFPGSYTVSEVQPAQFRDGKDTPGTTLGGAQLLTYSVADDEFANIGLAGGVDAIEFNFGELAVPTTVFTKANLMF